MQGSIEDRFREGGPASRTVGDPGAQGEGVAGMQGIGVNTPAQGHCIAKTGTLTGVTNLAGYCRTGQRHMIAFTILLDGPTNERGIVLLSRMTAAIARY